MKASVIVTGVPEIDRKLKTLEPRVQKKVVRQSMRDGLKVLAGEVQSQIPVESGLARSAVKVRAVRSRKRGSIELEVRISGKVEGLVKQPPNAPAAFYPAVVEYGDKNTLPNPFMRRSLDAKGEMTRQVTQESLLRGIEREASK